jgi:uncharacterized Zn finger protein
MLCIAYGNPGPYFNRQCPKCGRFVKFPREIKIDGFPKVLTKVKCKNCGKVEPEFMGWLDHEGKAV